MSDQFSMEVDYEQLLKHATELGQNSERIFNDYKKLSSDLETYSEKAMKDIKGDEFRKYIKEQEDWMVQLKKRFDQYQMYLETTVSPKVREYLDIDMGRRR